MVLRNRFGLPSILFGEIAKRHSSDSAVVTSCCSWLSAIGRSDLSLKLLVRHLMTNDLNSDTTPVVAMFVSNAAYTNNDVILKFLLPLVEKQSASIALYIKALLAKNIGYNQAALIYQEIPTVVADELARRSTSQDDVTENILTELAGVSSNVKPDTFIRRCEEKQPLQRLAGIDLWTSGRWVVVVSCDDKMFETYGRWFISNYRQKNTATIHFHISISETDVALSKRRLQSMVSEFASVNCTYDVIKPEERTWTSLSRLVLAPELMKCYGTNVVIMDLDSRPSFCFADILDFLCAHGIDVGTCSSQTLIPWVQINAGLMFVRATGNAANYLRIVSAYILDVISEGMHWTLDQAAMYQVYRYMIERGNGIKLMDLSGCVDMHRMVYSTPLRMRRRKLEHKGEIVRGVKFTPGRICSLYE
jgi:hypothetical protein